MKKLLIAIALAAGWLTIVPVAFSQIPTDQPLPSPQASVNLSVEQRHVIKEFVKDLPVQAATGDVPTSIGATVPTAVTLSPMPAQVSEKVPQVKSHMFFIKDGRIVLVSPKDNKIADVID